MFLGGFEKYLRQKTPENQPLNNCAKYAMMFKI